MALYSVTFAFRQAFAVDADRAFRWCIDFRPDDLRRMHEAGDRTVRCLTDDTFLLADRVPLSSGRRVTKLKLVRINRRARSWTSTHLSGPARHSQFVYRISPKGRGGSQLEFVGLQVLRARSPPAAAARTRLARQLRGEDAAAWKLLARAMEADLGKGRGRPRRPASPPSGR